MVDVESDMMEIMIGVTPLLAMTIRTLPRPISLEYVLTVCYSQFIAKVGIEPEAFTRKTIVVNRLSYSSYYFYQFLYIFVIPISEDR